jgi:hypothetical protein
MVDTLTLPDTSISIWCDNLPVVAWMYKFRSSTSLVAAQILRALTVRLHTNRAALLSADHISRIYNNMANVASRRHSVNNAAFLTEYSALFPPPQDKSWTLFLLSNKVTSKVCLELLSQQSTLKSWRRLPTKEYVFGKLGQTSPPPIFRPMTNSSAHFHNQNKSICWSFRLTGALRRCFTTKTTCLCANGPSIATSHHHAFRTGWRKNSGGYTARKI